MRFLKTLPILLAAVLFIPGQVFAQDNTSFCISNDFYARIGQYYNLAIGFAVLAAIFMIIFGGYRMVVSTGNPGLIQSGKQMVKNAIIGLIIAVLSAVILNVLNPRILNQGPCTDQTTGAYLLVEEVA